MLASRYDATVVIDGAALQDMFASCVVSSSSSTSNEPLPSAGICSPTYWLPLHVIRCSSSSNNNSGDGGDGGVVDRLYVSRALPNVQTLSNRRKNAMYYSMCLRSLASTADAVSCDHLSSNSSSSMLLPQKIVADVDEEKDTNDDELRKLASECGGNLQVS